MSGSAVEESTGKRKAGRPPKQGSVEAMARRLKRAEAGGDPEYLRKSESHQERGRKGAKAQGKAVATAPEEPKIHGMTLRAIRQRVLTEHEQAVASGRMTLSAAIPEAAIFLRQLVAGKIEGATVENRVQAAKIILTAGKIIGESSSKQRDGNDPADMSADELRAFIRAGMEQLAAMERDPIDVTPDSDRIMNPVALPDGSGS